MRKLRKFISLSWADKRFYIEAMFTLIIAWFLVRVVPFARWSHRLGTTNTETPYEIEHANHELAIQTSRVIQAIGQQLPSEPSCLINATTAKIMLRRRGIPSTLYLGVQKKADTPKMAIYAHAWLRAGELIVTGGPIHEDFTPLTTFGTEA